MPPFSSYSLQTVATQVPTMCMLVDQKLSPDLKKKDSLFFYSPYVRLFPVRLLPHEHSDCMRAWVHQPKVISFECNSDREAKVRVLPYHAHLFFIFRIFCCSSSPPPPISWESRWQAHSCLILFAMPGLIWSCDNPLGVSVNVFQLVSSSLSWTILLSPFKSYWRFSL